MPPNGGLNSYSSAPNAILEEMSLRSTAAEPKSDSSQAKSKQDQARLADLAKLDLDLQRP